MPTLDFSVTIAGGPYNVLNVIQGVQTTGVTQKTGSAVKPAQLPNSPYINIMVDPSVAGTAYVGNNNQVSAANLVGRPLLSGDNRLYDACQNINNVFSLANLWFAVDTDNMVIHLEWV